MSNKSNLQEFTFKLVITGETGTGKTSLLYRIMHNKFEENLNPTIAGDVTSYDATIDNKYLAHLTIWDTSGTEEYKSMNASHFADAQGIIYLYSADNSDSLENILTVWNKEAEENSKIEHINFIAGNKFDLPVEERTTSSDREDEVAKELHTMNHHISALNGEGVNDFVNEIVMKMIDKFNDNPQTQKQEYQPPATTKGGCCRI